MKIREDEGGFTLLSDEGDFIGEVTYIIVNGTYRLNHTYVDASQQGKGYAQQLVDLVCDKARKDNAKVVALCSYARVLFERNPQDYSDVAI